MKRVLDIKKIFFQLHVVIFVVSSYIPVVSAVLIVPTNCTAVHEISFRMGHSETYL